MVNIFFPAFFPETSHLEFQQAHFENLFFEFDFQIFSQMHNRSLNGRILHLRVYPDQYRM